MYGWRGRILRVDLSRGEVREESLDPQTAKDYIGGRGFGIRYLLKELDPACDPLAPENILVMAAGPLTGTAAPTGARYMVTTKSPLTGAVTCSNSGGRFPAELKKAGFDMIILQGRASELFYLWIDRGRAELRPAKHLWGKTTHETDAALRKETHAEARTTCIGPAGERLVRFASIMNDKDRAAGRSGVGAVMGSKKLKAVVVRGEGEVPLYDRKAFRDLVEKLNKKFRDSLKGGHHPLRLHGTAVTVMATQNYGVLPRHHPSAR